MKFDFSQSPLLFSVNITMNYHPLTLQMSIPLDLVCYETAGLAFAKTTPELAAPPWAQSRFKLSTCDRPERVCMMSVTSYRMTGLEVGQWWYGQTCLWRVAQSLNSSPASCNQSVQALDESINAIDWLACFPDVTTTEHVWDVMSQKSRSSLMPWCSSGRRSSGTPAVDSSETFTDIAFSLYRGILWAAMTKLMMIWSACNFNFLLWLMLRFWI